MKRTKRQPYAKTETTEGAMKASLVRTTKVYAATATANVRTVRAAGMSRTFIDVEDLLGDRWVARQGSTLTAEHAKAEAVAEGLWNSLRATGPTDKDR